MNTTATKPIRTTIYFDPKVLQALKLKGIESDLSVSSLTNEAIKQQLLEDYEDLSAFEERKDEEAIPFENFLAELKQNGEI